MDLNFFKALISRVSSELEVTYHQAYELLVKAARGEQMPGHKYVRRTGGPGNYKYDYGDGKDRTKHYFAIGASPVRNITMEGLKQLTNSFKEKYFKDFKQDVDKEGRSHKCDLIMVDDTGGTWMDTDLQHVVFEPSVRIVGLNNSVDQIRAYAATLGKLYNQQSVYCVDFGGKGGYEYSIKFENLEDAQKVLAKQEDYGFVGSSLNIKKKMIYFGDTDGSMLENFSKLLNDLDKKGVRYDEDAKQGKVEFIAQKDYDKVIARGAK